MPDAKAEETYYDVLKVDPKATVAEIVAAYHTARNAFSRDSVATYSLFSPEEAQGILAKLDEAYHTLSNIEKKRQYDEQLRARASEENVPAAMTELEIKQKAHLLPGDGAAPAEGNREVSRPAVNIPLGDYPEISGPVLKEIREKRGMTVEEVNRVTKIPLKFIAAIEAENSETLPARVYLQGFVKNLATLYKIDPRFATQSYLSRLDKPKAGG